jgi:integrase
MIDEALKTINKDELLSKYEINLANAVGKNHYLSYAKAFLKYANELNKESITDYIKKLMRQGKSPGTVNFAFRVIRRLFFVNNLEWPFRRGEAPPLTGERKAALPLTIIKPMIDAAKSNKLKPDESCFLAISTIYGVRREELCKIKPEHINHKDNLIFIDTIKGGTKRWHLIPPEILPYLTNHDFSQRYGVSTMSHIFWQIVNKSGLQQLKNQRLGWHNIRTCVVTLLHRSGLDPFLVHSFMRWKGAERDFAMDVRYDATSWVDLEGERVIAKEAQSDKEVFKKHPLLKLWR